MSFSDIRCKSSLSDIIPIYGVEEYPDSLVFYIDGTRTRSYPRVLTDKPHQFPFDDTNLDLFIGIRLDRDTDSAALPVDMFILGQGLRTGDGYIERLMDDSQRYKQNAGHLFMKL